MSVVNLKFHDRFGNNLFQYAFARAYADRVGAELRTTPWDGQKLFGLTEALPDRELPQRADLDIDEWGGETEIEITGWALHQKCLLYSRSDVRKWFTFTSEIESLVAFVRSKPLVAHLRWGDFKEMADFVAVSTPSYLAACDQYGLDCAKLTFVSEWVSSASLELAEMGLSYLPDFVGLMRAETLLRSNSTFAWWAATLGHGRVFSPYLRGIEPIAGITQSVPFVEGNHCAISCVHPNCTDLHLRET